MTTGAMVNVMIYINQNKRAVKIKPDEKRKGYGQ
jgi:hypothetical protein